ncbi:hypothetical protein BRADI_3g10800v3 [Brachypodium distachyon]|uniref:F-box/LRR-repeat protein 15/At3g58940/PEG3-like LRR domain-containing protein n=1 Tax=Brachypodium distachyon TaxID=15368 RepID=A0A2K2CWG9_BRADI|nr:hypothetical protein BRADI_3g10800v3 [Brachypodium distachyon]
MDMTVSIILAPKLESFGCTYMWARLFLRSACCVKELPRTLKTLYLMMTATSNLNDTFIELIRRFPCLENLHVYLRGSPRGQKYHGAVIFGMLAHLF